MVAHKITWAKDHWVKLWWSSSTRSLLMTSVGSMAGWRSVAVTIGDTEFHPLIKKEFMALVAK